MERYLNRGIKDIINEFPAIADVLNHYNIGCTNCSVGSCALKDIVDIHPLSQEDQDELMRQIAQILSPGSVITLPKVKREKTLTKAEIQYSPPVAQLVEEHKVIKRMIALLPTITSKLSLELSQDEIDLVLKIVDFIRNYADKFHHAKEEDVLFPYFKGNKEILQVMYEDHSSGRNHVKAVLDAVAHKNVSLLKKHLLLYRELLTEHIKKEDEILYPLMDRNFSDREVGELYKKFKGVNETFANNPKMYSDFVADLEVKFS